MAYMSQEHKKQLAPAIKQIMKKYGIKGTIGVNNHSTLVVNITSGKLDFIQNYIDKNTNNLGNDVIEYLRKNNNINVNHYYIGERFSGNVKWCLEELYKVMMQGNHDNSDTMTDYFDVGWYIDINIGKWNKPYIVEK